MGNTPLVQDIAMGVGAAGALVTLDRKLVRAVEGVSAMQGRDDGFRSDTPAGTIDFYLENYDGRFTPDNLTAALAAGYFTAVTEGMQVTWSRGGKLGWGRIRGIEFAGTEQDWGIVHITCDDMLGDAARDTVTDTALALWTASGGFLRWAFADPAGSAVAAEQTSNLPLVLFPNDGTATFGVTPAAIPVTSVLETTSVSTGIGLSRSLSTTYAYGSTTMGSYGFWIEFLTNPLGGASGFFSLIPVPGNSNLGFTITTTTSAGLAAFKLTAAGGSDIIGPAITTLDRAYFVEVVSATTFGAGVWTVVWTLWVDGVSYGNSTVSTTPATLTDTSRSPQSIFLSTGGAITLRVANLTHTLRSLNEAPIGSTTPALRLSGIAATVPEITLDTLPATLATTPLAPFVNDGSVLDAFNDVTNAEQGYIYTATTGTITAPVPKIVVRERTRPLASSVTAANTFDVNTEMTGVPQFIRDITNMIATETVVGPSASATYTDTTLSARVQSKNGSDSLPLRDTLDLYNWATDRVWRGANVQLRTAAISIDARTTGGTTLDRSTDLLALKQGDRIRAANISTAMLPFSTWDGWIIGIREHHSRDENRFDFLCVPCLPDTAIFDTDRYAAGGILSLTSTINAAVTSLSCTSAGALFTTAGGDLPVTIRIENECITVGAASGASSPQTLSTLTRGAVDPLTGLATTAAAHTAGALIELAAPALYAF